jgi:predicted O-methyltransferase YrrM
MLKLIEQKIDKLGYRGKLRKTIFYKFYLIIKALNMFFDKKMYYLYSRQSFKDALNFKDTNEISVWLNSFFSEPENIKQNLEIKPYYPWICFEAINYLTFFLLQKKNPICFEWGSGTSTLYLSKLVKQLYSVENNFEYFTAVKKSLSKNNIRNVNLINIKETTNDKLIDERYISWKNDYNGKNFYNYVRSIENLNTKFDLIFIDGECRNACFDIALNNLKEDGLIVFDNTSRKIYKQELENLDNKYKVITVTGHTPYSQTFDSTSFIFKK